MTDTCPIGNRSTSAVDRLPVAALLALALTGFVAILTETLPAGLLPQISTGLRISPAMTGQLVTLYAAGSLVAALPLTVATQGWRRRRVLLSAIIGFLVFNSITAFSSAYALTLTARFLAGVAAGLAWGIIAGYARRMVAESLRGRALAVAMVGIPLALSLGVPAGSFLGGAFGWPVPFVLMSGLTLVLVGWVCWTVPDFPGTAADQRLSVVRVLLRPGIRPVLGVIFLWMVAHNILYTYVAAFVAAAGLDGTIDRVLLDFGLSAVVGIWATGILIDRFLRPLVLASLAGFALAVAALAVDRQVPAVIYAAVACWGVTFGGAGTQLGTAVADAAGEGVDLGQALVTTVWNSAIAAGGLTGGILLTHLGPSSFPLAMLGLLLLALVIVGQARAHGFPPGPRSTDPTVSPAI